MKIKDLKTIIKEETKKMLSEGQQWPIGHFEVINTFAISPGGGWQVTFRKGDIIRVEDAGKMGYPGIQKIQKWDALESDWVKKAPPIRGMEVFPIDKFSGSRNWVDTFTKNTKAMSKGAAESKMKSQEASTIVTAAEGIKMLQGLQSNQQVKITIIK